MSPKAKTGTRGKILDAAETLIIEKGYTGTSVDSIIEEVGITKGAYFYHFKSKAEMAKALVIRNADLDIERMREFSARARQLSADPLESLLIFIGLYTEMVTDVTGPVPGCLFVSYSSETSQFDGAVREVLERVIVVWREHLAAWLDEAAAVHPPVREFDRRSLADMLTVVLEGCFVVARMAQDGQVFAQQLRHYRNYVEMLFKGV